MKKFDIKKIREIRKMKGLSQQEFAKVIGVTKQLISLWEKGENLPSMKSIIKLINTYDIDFNYFFDEER
jgi:transcriptional regulator with XRE-family HTH domain